MANTAPPAKPAAPPPPPAAKVEAAAAEPPVRTIADEQRERSDEIAAMGSDAWVKAHDERADPDAKKAVAGVQHRPVEAHEIRR